MANKSREEIIIIPESLDVDENLMKVNLPAQLLDYVMLAIAYAGFDRRRVYTLTNNQTNIFQLVMVLFLKGTAMFNPKKVSKYPSPEAVAIRSLYTALKNDPTYPITSSMLMNTYNTFAMRVIMTNYQGRDTTWSTALKKTIKGLPIELHYIGLSGLVAGKDEEIGDFEDVYKEFLYEVATLTTPKIVGQTLQDRLAGIRENLEKYFEYSKASPADFKVTKLGLYRRSNNAPVQPFMWNYRPVSV